MKDYRDALRAKGIKPMTAADRAKLRTKRRSGDLELTPDGVHRHQFDDPNNIVDMASARVQRLMAS